MRNGIKREISQIIKRENSLANYSTQKDKIINTGQNFEVFDTKQYI